MALLKYTRNCSRILLGRMNAGSRQAAAYATYYDENGRIRYRENHSKEDEFERQLRVKAKQRKKRWTETIHSWRDADKLLKHLIDGKIYEDENIIVLDKPTGLPMIASQYERVSGHPEDVYSMCDVLPKNLRPLYSQPRLYSGVVMYTKTPEITEQYQKLFFHYRSNKIRHSVHWAIVYGLTSKPDPEEKLTMFVHRKMDPQTGAAVYVTSNKKPRSRRNNNFNIFEMTFRVICSSHIGRQRTVASLVEIESYVCKWDNLELAFVENFKSPVLGDHRYSHRVFSINGAPFLLSAEKAGNYIHPQVLPSGIEKAMNLKSLPEVLDIPLYIHGLELVIPKTTKYKGSQMVPGSALEREDCNIFRAPLPPYFRRTMDQLGLVLPKKEVARLQEKSEIKMKYFKPKTKEQISGKTVKAEEKWW